MDGIRFDGSTLASSMLMNSSYKNTSFVGVDMSHARCCNSDFTGADSTNAKFVDVDPIGANFTNTIITNADFTGVDMANVDITNTIDDNHIDVSLTENDLADLQPNNGMELE